MNMMTALVFGVGYNDASILELMAKSQGDVICARSANDLAPQAEILAPCFIMFSFHNPPGMNTNQLFDPWVKNIIMDSLNGSNPDGASVNFAPDLSVINLEYSRISVNAALVVCRALEKNCTMSGGNIY
jgi:hypothetical protein